MVSPKRCYMEVKSSQVKWGLKVVEGGVFQKPVLEQKVGSMY